MKKIMELLQNMKAKNEKKDNKGFSLVELMIVIAIRAILVGVVGTQVIPYINKSKESKDFQIVSSFGTAAMTAYSSNADKISTASTISFNVYATGLSGDAATLQTAIQDLTYSTFPSTKFKSTKGKTITDITITYDFGAKTITAQATDGTNNVLDPVVSDM